LNLETGCDEVSQPLMPSLDSLVATHHRVLLIDSASACIQVGLWRPGREAIWHASEQEAGIAIFAGVDAVLTQARIGVADLGAAVFCEGPGSILGIRTAAMALRTWSAAEGRPLPAFAYRSLDLVAHDLRRRGIPAPFAVLADARRDSWHWVEAPIDGTIGSLQRVPPGTVAGFGGRRFTPAGFRVWARPPGEISTVPYALPDLWQHQRDADLLRAAPQPDAFLHEEATYVAWTPQIHRAATGVRPPRRR
jgi:tRNA threonylcarbamoyladenosine biosynthesis protein TsaB